MIDLHAHLLPGLDDGPATVEESVETARAIVAEGTRTLATTPHLRDDHPAVVASELAARTAALRTALGEAGVALDLVSGAEIDILRAREASPEELRLASYGGRGTHVLVETPYGPLPDGFEHLLFELTLAGLQILLAHPERNPSFQQHPGRLARLVERGVLVQVTAMALASSNRGSRSRRLGLSLVEEGLAHVIASDAHALAMGRPVGLAAGVAAAAAVAPARAEWMVTDAPAAILAGEDLPSPPAEPRRLRRGLRRLVPRA